MNRLKLYSYTTYVQMSLYLNLALAEPKRKLMSI